MNRVPMRVKATAVATLLHGRGSGEWQITRPTRGHRDRGMARAIAQGCTIAPITRKRRKRRAKCTKKPQMSHGDMENRQCNCCGNCPGGSQFPQQLFFSVSLHLCGSI